MSKRHHFFYQMFYNVFDMDKQEILIENEKISIVYMNKDMAFDVWQNSLDEDNRRFVPDEVFEAAARCDRYIAQSLPVKNGRIELALYIKEQSISNEYHRYGSQIEVPEVE